jgi:glycine oxidase
MALANIVVAGAGALGSATALALARAGHAVTLVDPTGVNASAIAAGMLAPAFESLFDEADYALLIEARDRWPALAAGIGLSLDRRGAIAVGEVADAQAWAERLRDLGAAASMVRPEHVADVAPWLAPGLWGAATPADWRLDAATALLALRRAAVAQGVSFAAGEVSGFARGKVRVADSGDLAADIMVLATGAATGIAPELAWLAPIKGHILRAPASLPAGPVVRAPGVYICPGDEVVVGATMEAGRGDAEIDEAQIATLAARAAALAPGLADAAWRPAAGVRAATPDGLPMVGWSRTGRVIVAAGARRNGWLLAPLIAETIAATVAGAAPDPRFDPARF